MEKALSHFSEVGGQGGEERSNKMPNKVTSTKYRCSPKPHCSPGGHSRLGTNQAVHETVRVLSRPGVDGEEGADQLGPLAGPLPHASRPSRTSSAPGPAALLTSAGPQLERGPRAASRLPDCGDSKVNREAPALPGPPLRVGGDAKCSASLASDTMFHVTSGAARLGEPERRNARDEGESWASQQGSTKP